MGERYAPPPSLRGSAETGHEPLPSALRAAREALRGRPGVAGSLSVALTEEIAARTEVPEDGIVLGPSTPSLAFALLHSLRSSRAASCLEVRASARGAGACADLARRLPARCVLVPPDPSGAQDLDALAEGCGDGLVVLFLSNPHDPTGAVVPGGTLLRFLEAVPEQAVVVVDESRWEFVRDDDFTPGTELVGHDRRLVVLRSLSAAHGLGGLRLAYAACDPEMAELIQRQILPSDIDTMAQGVALASLRSPDEVRVRADAVVRERERLREELQLLGFRVAPSETDRIWLPLGEDSTRFTLAGRRAGVDLLLGLGEGVGYTVGPPRLGDRLLEAAARFADRPCGGRYPVGPPLM
ncbi:aminotransferase class I/II-fold pyridoxal phosphate-dependent enzyme [Streptomyces sp. NPDC093018]|uniref:aminotransferase class I/II-fold pyridoxal phosphate-dependent enzyme n=1 Tax=Streptomyces sp. NPDC093018 TaxID=3155067 RepID=UPI0034171F0D